MNKGMIDRMVWWIPIKKLRNTVRNFFVSYNFRNVADVLDKMNLKYAGKEGYFCKSVYQDIVIAPNRLQVCCAGCPVFNFGEDINKFNLVRWFKYVNSVLDGMQNESGPCSKCLYRKRTIIPKLDKKHIKTVAISNYSICNASCVYCCAPDSYNKNYYDMKFDPITLVLQKFIDFDMLNDDFLIQTHGGEPFASKYMSKIIDYVAERNILFEVFSTFISVPDNFFKLVKNDKVYALVSVDSGTKETYKKIKQVDRFDKCWENIERFCNINSNNIDVQYLFFEYNANIEEIEKFVKKCLSVNVRNVTIACDLVAARGGRKEWENINDNYFKLAGYLMYLLKKNEINVRVLEHVWYKQENVKKIYDYFSDYNSNN